MKVTITIWYFKDTGKYYTDGEFMVVTDSYYTAIKSLEHFFSTGKMPGLSGKGWDGPILINSDDGFPILLNLDKRYKMSQE